MAVVSAPDDLGIAADEDPGVRYRRVLIARLAVVIVILAIWQAVVSGGLVDAFWSSSPVLAVQELWRAISRGLLLTRSPFWYDVLAPLVLALNSLARIALAPLIILWFGIGITAKVVNAFTLVFFILLVNTLGGAKNVDNDILTIARLMGASKRDILWKVTLPSALPWIFAGLNLGLTYS